MWKRVAGGGRRWDRHGRGPRARCYTRQIVQIKAQGLLNAAKWIEAEYGRDTLGVVVRACSPGVRDRYISGIAINWHPVEEFIEFVETADRMIGRGKGQLAEEIGAAGARANMKGPLVRGAFYLAQPEFFLRRVASLWQQFNDEGQMLVNTLEEHASSVELTGLKTPNATFCAVLTGWTRQVATSLGARKPAVRHAQCRARGDTRCLWDIRWSAIDPEEERKRSSTGHDSAGRHPAASPGRFPSSGSLPATSPAPGRPMRFPSSGTLPATQPASAHPPSSEKAPASGETTPQGRPPSAEKVPSLGEAMSSSGSRKPLPKGEGK